MRSKKKATWKQDILIEEVLLNKLRFLQYDNCFSRRSQRKRGPRGRPNRPSASGSRTPSGSASASASISASASASGLHPHPHQHRLF